MYSSIYYNWNIIQHVFPLGIISFEKFNTNQSYTFLLCLHLFCPSVVCTLSVLFPAYSKMNYIYISYKCRKAPFAIFINFKTIPLRIKCEFVKIMWLYLPVIFYGFVWIIYFIGLTFPLNLSFSVNILIIAA